MSNQGLRQASVRAVTGTSGTYEGDWHALFTQASIPVGDFNGRLLAWINAQLSTSYTEINGAMAAYAISKGASNWSGLGTFTTGPAPDTTPDAFTFTPQTGATPSTTYTSNVVLLSGFDTAAAYSVAGTATNPLVAIEGGAFTNTPGTVSPDSTVQARGTSSATSGTTTVIVTVGGVSGTFSITVP